MGDSLISVAGKEGSPSMQRRPELFFIGKTRSWLREMQVLARDYR